MPHPPYTSHHNTTLCDRKLLEWPLPAASPTPPSFPFLRCAACTLPAHGTKSFSLSTRLKGHCDYGGDCDYGLQGHTGPTAVSPMCGSTSLSPLLQSNAVCLSQVMPSVKLWLCLQRSAAAILARAAFQRQVPAAGNLRLLTLPKKCSRTGSGMSFRTSFSAAGAVACYSWAPIHTLSIFLAVATNYVPPMRGYVDRPGSQ